MPASSASRWQHWRVGLFGSPLNSLVTFLVLLGLWRLALPFFDWALFDATWSGDAAICHEHGGACWTFVAAKFRLMLFGFFPGDLLWRPAASLALLVALVAATAVPALWRRGLLLAWVFIPLLVCVLMSDGLSGRSVPTDQWGGLPLTLLLSVAAFAGAFPFAVLLALGRRSSLGGIRLVSTAFIEILRGVPMIVVLYVATLVVPLMLGQGVMLDKLLRAAIGLVLFIAAYLAEIIRAGLQALPTGQEEAARALGLSYGQTLRLIVLPQALRAVIPALVNLAIGLVQNTPLLAAIGIFDFLKTVQTAADSDQLWLGFANEAYLCAALIYFGLCFGASRYSLWLERRLRPG